MRATRAVSLGVVLIVILALTAAPVGARSSAPDPVLGHFRVAFLLCDFKSWHYAPNSLSFYRKLWVKQNPTGTFRSLADYFHDESYGRMDLKGSTVTGWYRIPIGIKAWYSGGNGNRTPVRWLSCVNAALAGGLGTSIIGDDAVVAVTPKVTAFLTGGGVAAEPALKKGQARPAPEKITVSSLKSWPPAPFLMSLPPDSLSQFGENVLVTKVSGKTLTISRGYNAGQTQLKGPYPAIGPGPTVVPDTNDDFGSSGLQTFFLQLAGQPCASAKTKRCPSLTTTRLKLNLHNPLASTNIAVPLPPTNLFAGVGTLQAGVGNSAHEVGHATGYNHSRVLSSSTTDYSDCYDQMSFNACGLPGFPGLFGPAEGIIGYDAINLEYHGWIPSRLQFDRTNHTVKQATIKLHALSDPRAPTRSAGEYLDAHVPAHVKIEDVGPNNASGNALPPTIPPTCSGTGYNCATSKYYTVEYRQLYGFDAALREQDFSFYGGPPRVGAVVLHLYAPDKANPNRNISYLVDSYPGQTTGRNKPIYLPDVAALQPGDAFADPAHNTYIAVNAFDEKTFTATVTVSSTTLAARFKFPGPRTAKAGTTTTLTARLVIGGAPVPGRLVSLSLGPGQGCGPVFTDSTGLAKCTVALSSAVGTRPFQTYFSGDSAYRVVSQYSTFSVTP